MFENMVEEKSVSTNTKKIKILKNKLKKYARFLGGKHSWKTQM